MTSQILRPSDDGYDIHRRVWNAMVDRRPAMIARCASPADVAAAIRLGLDQDLEIGVRCGGHSVLGQAVPEGGLMIDLTPLSTVRVDPEKRRAWVQGGALLGALDRATQPYGLATTAGNVSHTGVGGLTLGGGMGWLARRYGLSCDNVTSFELVTADGDLVRATETENADLFWGLRGGGGNFGVVTEFEFQLHDVGREALLVDLFFRPEDAVDAVRRWRDLLPEAPRQSTFTAWTGTAGSGPAEIIGRDVVSVGYVWVGDPDAGRGLLASVTDAVKPIASRELPMSYVDLQVIDDSPMGHERRQYWKGHYLNAFGDDAIDAFLARGGDLEPAFRPSGSLQSHGGAIADIRPEDAAFSHRDTVVEFVGRTTWDDPTEDGTRMAAARQYGATVEPYASGVYVNDLADEGDTGVERAYRAGTLDRLRALKRRYDPDNVFHLNHNIKPA